MSEEKDKIAEAKALIQSQEEEGANLFIGSMIVLYKRFKFVKKSLSSNRSKGEITIT